MLGPLERADPSAAKLGMDLSGLSWTSSMATPHCHHRSAASLGMGQSLIEQAGQVGKNIPRVLFSPDHTGLSEVLGHTLDFSMQQEVMERSHPPSALQDPTLNLWKSDWKGKCSFSGSQGSRKRSLKSGDGVDVGEEEEEVRGSKRRVPSGRELLMSPGLSPIVGAKRNSNTNKIPSDVTERSPSLQLLFDESRKGGYTPCHTTASKEELSPCLFQSVGSSPMCGNDSCEEKTNCSVSSLELSKDDIFETPRIGRRRPHLLRHPGPRRLSSVDSKSGEGRDDEPKGFHPDQDELDSREAGSPTDIFGTPSSTPAKRARTVATSDDFGHSQKGLQSETDICFTPSLPKGARGAGIDILAESNTPSVSQHYKTPECCRLLPANFDQSSKPASGTILEVEVLMDEAENIVSMRTSNQRRRRRRRALEGSLQDLQESSFEGSSSGGSAGTQVKKSPHTGMAPEASFVLDNTLVPDMTEGEAQENRDKVPVVRAPGISDLDADASSTTVARRNSGDPGGMGDKEKTTTSSQSSVTGADRAIGSVDQDTHKCKEIPVASSIAISSISSGITATAEAQNLDVSSGNDSAADVSANTSTMASVDSGSRRRGGRRSAFVYPSSSQVVRSLPEQKLKLGSASKVQPQSSVPAVSEDPTTKQALVSAVGTGASVLGQEVVEGVKVEKCLVLSETNQIPLHMPERTSLTVQASSPVPTPKPDNKKEKSERVVPGTNWVASSAALSSEVSASSRNLEASTSVMKPHQAGVDESGATAPSTTPASAEEERSVEEVLWDDGGIDWNSSQLAVLGSSHPPSPAGPEASVAPAVSASKQGMEEDQPTLNDITFAEVADLEAAALSDEEEDKDADSTEGGGEAAGRLADNSDPLPTQVQRQLLEESFFSEVEEQGAENLIKQSSFSSVSATGTFRMAERGLDFSLHEGHLNDVPVRESGIAAFVRKGSAEGAEREGCGMEVGDEETDVIPSGQRSQLAKCYRSESEDQLDGSDTFHLYNECQDSHVQHFPGTRRAVKNKENAAADDGKSLSREENLSESMSEEFLVAEGEERSANNQEQSGGRDEMHSDFLQSRESEEEMANLGNTSTEHSAIRETVAGPVVPTPSACHSEVSSRHAAGMTVGPSDNLENDLLHDMPPSSQINSMSCTAVSPVMENHEERKPCPNYVDFSEKNGKFSSPKSTSSRKHDVVLDLLDIEDQNGSPRKVPEEFMGFRTAAGTSISLSESALQKARLLYEVPEEHEQASSATGNVSTEVPPAFEGFKTASGAKLSVGEKALSMAKSKFGDVFTENAPLDTEGPPVFEGFKTALGRGLAVDKKAIEAAESKFGKLFGEKDTNSSAFPSVFEGFKTASGRGLPVEEEAMKTAKAKFGDVFTENVPQHNEDPHFFEGFKTASGRGLQVDEEAMKIAKAKFGDLFEDVDSNSSGNPTVFQGFTTASGSRLEVGEKALRNAKRKFADLFEDEKGAEVKPSSDLDLLGGKDVQPPGGISLNYQKTSTAVAEESPGKIPKTHHLVQNETFISRSDSERKQPRGGTSASAVNQRPQGFRPFKPPRPMTRAASRALKSATVHSADSQLRQPVIHHSGGQGGILSKSEGSSSPTGSTASVFPRNPASSTGGRKLEMPETELEKHPNREMAKGQMKEQLEKEAGSSEIPGENDLLPTQIQHLLFQDDIFNESKEDEPSIKPVPLHTSFAGHHDSPVQMEETLASKSESEGSRPVEKSAVTRNAETECPEIECPETRREKQGGESKLHSTTVDGVLPPASDLSLEKAAADVKSSDGPGYKPEFVTDRDIHEKAEVGMSLPAAKTVASRPNPRKNLRLRSKPSKAETSKDATKGEEKLKKSDAAPLQEPPQKQEMQDKSNTAEPPEEFVGFRTVAGSSTSLSESALQKARLLCEVPEEHEQTSSAAGSVSTEVSPAFEGFKTASGAKLSVGEKAMSMAKSKFADLFAENVQQKSEDHQVFEGFKTASGKGLAVDEKTLKRAEAKFGNLFADSDSNSTEGPNTMQRFKSIPNPGLTEGEKAIKVAKGDLIADSGSERGEFPPGFEGFKTASGRKLKVEENALKTAKAKFGDLFAEKDLHSSEAPQALDGFKTAAGMKLEIADKTMEAVQRKFGGQFNENDPRHTGGAISFEGFQTASGTRLNMSEKALGNVKRKFGDLFVEDDFLSDQKTSRSVSPSTSSDQIKAVPSGKNTSTDLTRHSDQSLQSRMRNLPPGQRPQGFRPFKAPRLRSVAQAADVPTSATVQLLGTLHQSSKSLVGVGRIEQAGQSLEVCDKKLDLQCTEGKISIKTESPAESACGQPVAEPLLTGGRSVYDDVEALRSTPNVQSLASKSGTLGTDGLAPAPDAEISEAIPPADLAASGKKKSILGGEGEDRDSERKRASDGCDLGRERVGSHPGSDDLLSTQIQDLLFQDYFAEPEPVTATASTAGQQPHSAEVSVEMGQDTAISKTRSESQNQEQIGTEATGTDDDQEEIQSSQLKGSQKSRQLPKEQDRNSSISIVACQQANVSISKLEIEPGSSMTPSTTMGGDAQVHAAEDGSQAVARSVLESVQAEARLVSSELEGCCEKENLFQVHKKEDLGTASKNKPLTGLYIKVDAETKEPSDTGEMFDKSLLRDNNPKAKMLSDNHRETLDSRENQHVSNGSGWLESPAAVTPQGSSVDIAPSLAGFKTASGSAIALSKGAVEKAKQRFGFLLESSNDDGNQVAETSPAFEGFKTASGSRIILSAETLGKIQGRFSDWFAEDEARELGAVDGNSFSDGPSQKVSGSESRIHSSSDEILENRRPKEVCASGRGGQHSTGNMFQSLPQGFHPFKAPRPTKKGTGTTESPQREAPKHQVSSVVGKTENVTEHHSEATIGNHCTLAEDALVQGSTGGEQSQAMMDSEKAHQTAETLKSSTREEEKTVDRSSGCDGLCPVSSPAVTSASSHTEAAVMDRDKKDTTGHPDVAVLSTETAALELDEKRRDQPAVCQQTIASQPNTPQPLTPWDPENLDNSEENACLYMAVSSHCDAHPEQCMQSAAPEYAKEGNKALEEDSLHDSVLLRELEGAERVYLDEGKQKVGYQQEGSGTSCKEKPQAHTESGGAQLVPSTSLDASEGQLVERDCQPDPQLQSHPRSPSGTRPALFSTASGHRVSVSAGALAAMRTKVLHDDLLEGDAPSNRSASGAGEVQASGDGEPQADQNDKATHRDRPTWAEKSTGHSPFCTALGQRVGVSQEALATVAAGKDSIQGRGAPADQDTKQKMGLSPFSTASGRPVGVTAEAMQAVRGEMVSEDVNQDGLVAVKAERKGWDNPFCTASGKAVNVSAEAMQAVRGEMASEDTCQDELVAVKAERKAWDNRFCTASGKTINVSAEAVRVVQGRTALDDQSSRPPAAPASGRKVLSSLFSTASGKAVSISEEAIRAVQGKEYAEEFSTSLPCTETTSKSRPVNPFSTASGHLVSVSDGALLAVQRKHVAGEANDDDNQHVSVPDRSSLASPFSTASGKTVSVSEQALNAVQRKDNEDSFSSHLPNTSTPVKSSSMNPFSTASGKAVGVSEQALQAVLRKYSDDSFSSHLPNTSTPVKSSSMNPFSTASGKAVAVSEEALHAVLRKDSEDSFNSHLPITSTPVKTCPENPFSTASGKAVTVSEQALSAVQGKNFTDDFSDHLPLTSTPVKDLRANPFNTASGKMVTISEEALHAVQGKEYTNSDIPLDKGWPLNPFNTASGKTVAVLEKALKAVQGREDFVVPSISPEEAASHSIDSLSGFLSFHGDKDLAERSGQTSGNVARELEHLEDDELNNIQQQPESHQETRTHMTSPHKNNGATDEEALGCQKSTYVDKSIGNKEGEHGLQGAESLEHTSRTALDLPKTNTGTHGLAAELVTGMEVPEEKAGFLDLAAGAALQARLIAEKKTQRVRPCPGRYFRLKQGGGQPSFHTWSLQLRQQCQDAQQQQWCVDPVVARLDSGGAGQYCLDMRRWTPGGRQCCLWAGDGALLVPDSHSMAGAAEFYRALLTVEGVDPGLVTERWLHNHYRWLVWKLARYEQAFPPAFAGRALTPDEILLQLKLRYDREVDNCHRSALRKILEQDDIAGKRMVLQVAAIRQLSGEGAQENAPHETCLELTDGWYSIPARLDGHLQDLLSWGRIPLGRKLCISGAQLSGTPDGCSPLDAPESARLVLSGNSVRPVPSWARLGFQRDPRPLPVPLASLSPRGGVAGCLCLLVARVLPLAYMERMPGGGTEFRSAEAEERAEARFQEGRAAKVEELQLRFLQESEQEQKRKRGRGRARQGGGHSSTDLMEMLGDHDSLDHLQGLLSGSQEWQLVEELRRRRAEQESGLQARVLAALQDTEFGSGRQVTPVLRCVVLGCARQDVDSRLGALLTVWRPEAEWLEVEEGQCLRVFHLNVAPSRSKVVRGLMLTATRSTRLQPLHVSDSLLDLLYLPREVWSVQDLRNDRPPYGLFDFVGVVLDVIRSGSQPHVHLCDSACNLLEVSLSGSLQSFGVERGAERGSMLVVTGLLLQAAPRWFFCPLASQPPDLCDVRGVSVGRRGSGGSGVSGGGGVTFWSARAEACLDAARFSASPSRPLHRVHLQRLCALPQATKAQLLERGLARLEEVTSQTGGQCHLLPSPALPPPPPTLATTVAVSPPLPGLSVSPRMPPLSVSPPLPPLSVAMAAQDSLPESLAQALVTMHPAWTVLVPSPLL